LRLSLCVCFVVAGKVKTWVDVVRKSQGVLGSACTKKTAAQWQQWQTAEVTKLGRKKVEELRAEVQKLVEEKAIDQPEEKLNKEVCARLLADRRRARMEEEEEQLALGWAAEVRTFVDGCSKTAQVIARGDASPGSPEEEQQSLEASAATAAGAECGWAACPLGPTPLDVAWWQAQRVASLVSSELFAGRAEPADAEEVVVYREIGAAHIKAKTQAGKSAKGLFVELVAGKAVRLSLPFFGRVIAEPRALELVKNRHGRINMACPAIEAMGFQLAVLPLAPQATMGAPGFVLARPARYQFVRSSFAH